MDGMIQQSPQPQHSPHQQPLQAQTYASQSIHALEQELAERKRLEDQLVVQLDRLENKLSQRNAEVRELRRYCKTLCAAVKNVLSYATSGLSELHGQAATSFQDGELAQVEDVLQEMGAHISKLKCLSGLFEKHLLDRDAILDKSGPETMACAHQFEKDVRELGRRG